MSQCGCVALIACCYVRRYFHKNGLRAQAALRNGILLDKHWLQ